MPMTGESLRDGAWLTPARLRAYSLILVVAYAVFLAWVLWSANGNADVMGRPLGTDFANIWSSGRLVLEGRPAIAFDPVLQRPFQQTVIGHDPQYFYGWHYPPQFLAIAGLLALLPYVPALLVWVAATTTLYVGMMRSLLRDVAPTRDIVLLALAFPAVFANATHGHNGTLTAALLGLGLLWLKERPIAAGVAFGLLAYKPQYGLLLPLVLAVGGHWRTIASATATVILVVAASVLLFGIESWQAFVTHAAYTKETILENGAAGWFKLQGLFPAVRMYGGSIATAYALQAIWMLVVAASLVWFWRASAHVDLKAAALVLATVLATPYAFNYDMVALAVAIGFLARHGLSHGFRPYEVSLLALLWVSPLVSRDLTRLTHLPIAFGVEVVVYASLLLTAFVPNSSFAQARHGTGTRTRAA